MIAKRCGKASVNAAALLHPAADCGGSCSDSCPGVGGGAQLPKGHLLLLPCLTNFYIFKGSSLAYEVPSPPKSSGRDIAFGRDRNLLGDFRPIVCL